MSKAKIPLKADLIKENVQLREMLQHQTRWIMSISEHYNSLMLQLTNVVTSMSSAQGNFEDFFQSIRDRAKKLKAENP